MARGSQSIPCLAGDQAGGEALAALHDEHGGSGAGALQVGNDGLEVRASRGKGAVEVGESARVWEFARRAQCRALRGVGVQAQKKSSS